MKVSVLFGGSSSEKDISVLSGLSVVEAISPKYDVNSVHITDEIRFLPEKLFDSNIVFNALHGGFGENGDIQSFLDLHNIIYTGSNAKASKIAIDKHLTKVIVESENIDTPDWITIKMDSFKKTELLNKNNNKLNYPFVIKPSNEGSTMGLSVARNVNELEKAIKYAGEFSNEIIIEEYIPGRELTVGILGNKALPVVEVIPKNELYDYESKYSKIGTKYIVPAKVSDSVIRKIQECSLKIHNLVGCRHYSRVDFKLHEDRYFFLEINSLPGLTATSLFPMAANNAGLDFPELIDTIIKIAVIDQ